MHHPATILPRPHSAGSTTHASAAGTAATGTLHQQQHQDTQGAVRYKSWQRLEPPAPCSTAPRPTTGRVAWPASGAPSAAERMTSAALRTAPSAPRSEPSEPWQRSNTQQRSQHTDRDPTAKQQTTAGADSRAAAEASHGAAETQQAEYLEVEHLEVSRQVLQLDADLRNAQVLGEWCLHA